MVGALPRVDGLAPLGWGDWVLRMAEEVAASLETGFLTVVSGAHFLQQCLVPLSAKHGSREEGCQNAHLSWAYRPCTEHRPQCEASLGQSLPLSRSSLARRWRSLALMHPHCHSEALLHLL